MKGNPDYQTYRNLETRRLKLRPLGDNDLEELFLLRSNPEVNRFLERTPALKREDAREFMQMISIGEAEMKWLYWVICQKEDGKLIGTLSLFNFSPDRSKAELGFELMPCFQGMGFMQEALEMVLKIVFDSLKLRFIRACVMPGNTRSIRILEKNGFKPAEVSKTIHPEEILLNSYILNRAEMAVNGS